MDFLFDRQGNRPLHEENVKSQNYEFGGKFKTLIKWHNQKLKHIKRIDNNCHIPDLVHAYSYVENGELNLVL